MLKIKKTHRFILGALILLIVLASVYVRRKNASPIRNGELFRLPDFVATDILGNKIKSSDLKGKYLYVQFIRPVDENNKKLFNNVYSNWKDEDLRFLIICKRYDQIKSNINIDSAKITILINDYDRLKSLFNAPEYGTFYLFDPSGSLIATEGNDTQYEQALKIILNQLIKNKNLLIEDFIPEKRNIKNIDWFKQISEIVEKEKKDFFVISLFTSICGGCTSGSNFQYLKDFHSKNREFTHVLCILSDKYNENDIINLKSQLRVEFPVFIADHALSLKWNSFIQEFNDAYLNNIMFITDKSGNIIRVLDPHCKKCWKPFFLFMKSLKPK